MKTTLHPAAWPRHDRPTSPGVVADRLVFTSGQVGTDHESGVLAGPTAYEQTIQALDNLAAVLSESGASLQDLTKVTVFVADTGDIADMNRGYRERMPQPWPARSCVQAGLARPDLRVEIEGIAVCEAI